MGPVVIEDSMGFQWDFRRFYGILWDSNGIPMGFYEILWDFMGFYDDFMGFNDDFMGFTFTRYIYWG